MSMWDQLQETALFLKSKGIESPKVGIVLGISVITNMATGIQTMKHSHENVLAIAKASADKISQLVEELVAHL